MVVGHGIVVLLIPEVRSLKEKRGVLRKILKRTQNEFNISIAEVGDQDLWGKAEVGFSLVGNDRRLIDAKMDHVFRFIEDLHLAEVMVAHREIVNLTGALGGDVTGEAGRYMAGKYGDEAYDDLQEGR
ncbi:MAG TPA: DUF503 domain-containing protein [Syntrophales bacterium]|nr:DUF503 domain-containing protein [Syntrophales bacterium]HOM06313.1 DUF503 domain-containing protein [Syntrophales bacterium]HON99248.1 DUF503 domain-containing protein [Syntrophales bacterium]HPC00073.1 DUF503 domain-containing protein [Syntrophales bacterium]HPQ05706.1 DUF503 domain-containing protein [Syntrophales bacterium]